ncbi:hypothetical protein ABZ820_12100 [Streptomyces diacarni]|uniref:hypothetical protein n=1 Tax=Streptomyces diacarni TaxID=2800381 RepID=UPI0033FF19F7
MPDRVREFTAGSPCDEMVTFATLRHLEPLLPAAGALALRLALEAAGQALTEVLRVAESRGRRVD